MTVEEYRRRCQGRANKAQGALFEGQIEAACEYYWANKIAHIEKTPEPLKPIKSLGAGKFLAVFEKDAQPDFKGTMDGGQAVCFEAKHTDTDRISQQVVLPQQSDSLDAHEELGALCFVMVSMNYRVYRVPWKDWKNMKTLFGHKYMNTEELAAYQVPYREGLYFFLE